MAQNWFLSTGYKSVSKQQGNDLVSDSRFKFPTYIYTYSDTKTEENFLKYNLKTVLPPYLESDQTQTTKLTHQGKSAKNRFIHCMGGDILFQEKFQAF